ncbi:MAG TPA: Hsp20/alpha crystallin family protein [Sulfuriferula sp.]|nr:Hsp20/alpha crystallin family protein [Sulfuriferula sp.]
MLDSLKKVGKEVGKELNRAWDNLSEGWREMLSRSGDALTHFTRQKAVEGTAPPDRFPSWSMLAGEVEETEKSILVRLEVPGLDRDDLELMIEGNTLRVSGEKRYAREDEGGSYHIMERAYGSFQRLIQLPQEVDGEQAEASLNNGVLTVRLPKTGAPSGRRIKVT